MLLPNSVPAAMEVLWSVTTSAVISELKSPMSVRRLLDQLDAALAQQHLGVDDVHAAVQGVLQQAGGEGRREQPGVLLGHLALVAQPAQLWAGRGAIWASSRPSR